MDRPAPIKPRSRLQIQRDVLYALLLREISSRFGKSRVGFIWVLVEPVAHLLFPILIFGFLRQSIVPGIEYPVFLAYGLLAFLLFKAICLQTMSGTNANRGLLSYRQVLLMDVFIARALATCFIQVIVFVIVLTGLGMIGFDVLPPRPVELGGALLLTVTLAFGLGLLFAAASSIAPDFGTVIRVMFLPLYFISGILFPVTRFPDEWVQWLALNPVLHLVELTRVAGVEHYQPMRYLSIAYPVWLALGSMFIGLMLYRLRYLARVTT
jgi:capsular polysaccharide transport system permease protein